MLKKLKRRFIIYTVSLFSVIAIATVTGLFYGEYTRWQNLTKNALDRMLESALITQRTLTTTTTDSRDQNSVGKHIGVSGDDAIEVAHAIDTFAVILNNDYSIQSMKTNSYSSIDDSLQRKLVAQVLQDNNQTGVIYSGNYVFRYIMKGNGIAFADVRNEYNALREMLVCLLSQLFRQLFSSPELACYWQVGPCAPWKSLRTNNGNLFPMLLMNCARR